MPDDFPSEISRHYLSHHAHVAAAFDTLVADHAAALQRIEALEAAIQAKVSFGYLRCGIAGSVDARPDTAVPQQQPL